MRDHDPRRYRGRTVAKAVAQARAVITPGVLGLDVTAQEEIDRRLVELDGTTDCSRLGANTMLAVSLACAHAAASALRVPLYAYLGAPAQWSLPLPMINIISGGLHAGTGLTLQDFLVVPYGARSFSEALEMASGIRSATLDLLQEERGYAHLVADEGGFGPVLANNQEALELLMRACEQAGYRPGEDAGIALDVAASHLLREGGYSVEPGEPSVDASEMISRIEDWCARFPLVSVEDALHEDDWPAWTQLTKRLGKRVQLVGDDLFVTSPHRLARGLQEGVANAILIKPNQIGTLTATLKVLKQAQAGAYRCIVSARSGETEDSTIADLAVATGAGQIKIGSLARSSRLAKYNQLLRIEEEIGAERFVGRQPLEAFLQNRKRL